MAEPVSTHRSSSGPSERRKIFACETWPSTTRDLEAAFADALEDVVPARCGQAPEHVVDLLDGGGLERDDGRDVAHHARVAEHALDAGFGEALEDGVQHL